MRAPRLLAAGTAAASLLLTGCAGLEKATPIVSVVSGGEFEHTEATTFCFEGQDPAVEPGEKGDCSFEELRPKLVEVQPGEQVGVDVAKDLSDGAWVVVLRPQGGGAGQDGQPQEQSSAVQDEHYFTFVPQFDGGAPLDMQVRLLESDDPGARVKGVWTFVLAPKV